jgi:hypothetical protein
VRIETYKADLTWERDGAGKWRFDFRQRTHLHLYCSLKGIHAGFKRQDPRAMKYWLDQVPPEVQRLLLGLGAPAD